MRPTLGEWRVAGLPSSTQLLFKGFAEFDVALGHVRRDVALLEEEQDPVDPSEVLAASASEVRIATRLWRSMLTSEFKSASTSRMECLAANKRSSANPSCTFAPSPAMPDAEFNGRIRDGTQPRSFTTSLP
jgi:hypothetical protein